MTRAAGAATVLPVASPRLLTHSNPPPRRSATPRAVLRAPRRRAEVSALPVPDKKTLRLLRALARDGLDVHPVPGGWRARAADAPDAPAAEVLLPPDLRLEAKALAQLCALAACRHPDGGRVTHARATPDFHPGDGGVAIGSVLRTEGQVVPQAVGGDINCGMRLHVVDLTVDRFLAHRDALVDRLKGDFFFGTRDVAQRAATQRAQFVDGLPGWVAAQRPAPLGSVARSDWAQLAAELDRVHLGGRLSGDLAWAPVDLVPDDGLVRDAGLATVGGGNHFVEVLWVDEVADRRAAWRWGVRAGQLAFMVHSGSRHVGRSIGRAWAERARDAWPHGAQHPRGGLFPLADPAMCRAYLAAEATAANYGFVNRLLLAELVRLRLRQMFGDDLEAPLVYDLPHNITLPDGEGLIARKGACPAEADQPVVIPGSMGTPSFLMRGLGNAAMLCSASHGAGRAKPRFDLHRADAASLGLDGVHCVTLRAERRVEEAPAAYKPIGPVVEAQVAAGVVAPVARLRPLLTFKA